MTADKRERPFQSRAKRARWLFLIVIALLPFALALWQWQRGQDKQKLLDALEQAAPPLRSAAWMPEFARMELEGGRAVGARIELRNSFLNGASGRRVLQPWRLADGSLMLLDLGWLADGAALPPLDGAAIRPQGRWLPLPHHFVLAGATRDFRGAVDEIDVDALHRAYAGPWHQGVLVLERAPAPLQPWPVAPDFPPQRHYAYAVQWLLLGLCLSGGVWMLWRRGP